MCTKDFRSTKAITLISLVVSIVVLLILAGVSIVTLTGDNGLLNQTTSAKQKTELATFKEKLKLAYMSAYTDNAQNGTYTVSMTDVLNQLVIDYPEYGQEGKIESRESGSVLSIVAKLGTTEINTTNPLILGTGETKTIVIEPMTPQGAGGTKFVNLEGKYYQIILDGNGVTLGEAQDNLPESENELEISKGEGLGNVSATETNDLNVEVEAGSTLDEGNITFTYGGKTTTVKVTVKTKYTVTAGVYSENTAKGSVSISPSSADNKYAEGSTVRLTATANTGYQLEGWYNGSTKLSENNPYDYEVGTSNITITAKFKIYEKYGKTVNLGTVTANSVAMASGWQYFLEDSNNIYLIYGDYLENVQIPTPTNISKSGYNVYASGSRDNLVNYLKGETATYSSSWNTINEAVKAAVKAKLKENGATEANANTAVANITTKGAPTPEQWMSSYNENYGTKLGAEYFSSTGQEYYEGSKGTSTEVASSPKEGGTSATGYLYTRDTTTNPVKYEDYLRNDFMATTGGYPGSENSNMYYPHTSTVSGCSGYWLGRLFD